MDSTCSYRCVGGPFRSDVAQTDEVCTLRHLMMVREIRCLSVQPLWWGRRDDCGRRGDVDVAADRRCGEVVCEDLRFTSSRYLVGSF
jgi:hypothetical protein